MSGPEPEVKRTDLKKLPPAERRAVTVYQQGWGLPAGPARKALCAITQAYGLDPVMGDIMVMGGNTLYITAAGCMKNVHKDPRFRRWTKRPATKEEKASQGYDEADFAWFVELWFVDVQGNEYVATEAFGQCTPENCQLQNMAKKVGDPRIMNRMAIKRGQHECTRDVTSFNLPKIEGVEQEELLDADVRIVTDDGIRTDEEQCTPDGVPTVDVQAQGPSVADVLGGEPIKSDEPVQSEPAPDQAGLFDAPAEEEPYGELMASVWFETYQPHSKGWKDRAVASLTTFREANTDLSAGQIVELVQQNKVSVVKGMLIEP